MQRLFYIICCFLALASCSKGGDGGSNDSISPTIVITAPVNNQVFNGGQTVTITAFITDNLDLGEVHAHIYNSSNNQLLIDKHLVPTSGSYSLNETFVAQAGFNYKVEVSGRDKSGNQGVGSVLIKTN